MQMAYRYIGRYRKAQELCAAVTSVVHAVDGAAFEVRVVCVWHIGMLLDCAHDPAWFMYVRTICTVTYPLHLQLTSVCS